MLLYKAYLGIKNANDFDANFCSSFHSVKLNSPSYVARTLKNGETSVEE